ncbi:hypothetical protein GCM10010218_51600 [Streptomyces mashuensis]|uniref:Neocarzinostatin family protein n=1 Tax=Streptomyces mashuensis TaxID=33904 RepID=A0A919B6Y2_9ACTN|nr:hypothetical protein [Streptomyces mashuensis]GHF63864.1 hypothetical protein GCM10010218_51600 [Streptomyces mashuensis]
MNTPGARRTRTALATAALLAVLPCATPTRAAEPEPAPAPALTLDHPEAAPGSALRLTGTGWRPGALVMLIICGQNMAGGTNACANGDGRTATVGADGRFRGRLPVVGPPVPCPCLVHAATVTGPAGVADAGLVVTGHPVAALPARRGGERLGVLDARLEGADGLLTWFGAPPRRRLVVTVANLGTGEARDPVFRLGTARGVLAPAWEERPWRGTVAPGGRERIVLDVELTAGAHGDYTVSLGHDGRVLAEQPWRVGWPWGVTLFWALLCVVVPLAVHRAGMAVVDQVRPRRPPRLPEAPAALPPGLPWFRPGTVPPPYDAPEAAPEAAPENAGAPGAEAPGAPPKGAGDVSGRRP